MADTDRNDGRFPVRLIFWPPGRDSVWLKADVCPEDMARLCREERCPCTIFGGCPLGRAGCCAGTSARDWQRLFAGKPPKVPKSPKTPKDMKAGGAS